MNELNYLNRFKSFKIDFKSSLTFDWMSWPVTEFPLLLPMVAKYVVLHYSHRGHPEAEEEVQHGKAIRGRWLVAAVAGRPRGHSCCSPARAAAVVAMAERSRVVLPPAVQVLGDGGEQWRRRRTKRKTRFGPLSATGMEYFGGEKGYLNIVAVAYNDKMRSIFAMN